MKCENFKELILEYPDGELSQGERLQVETHLGECEGCDLLFRQVNGVWNLLDRWDGIEPEGDFVAKFWDRVSEGEIRGGGGILDFFRNWRQRWAIAVAVAVILIVGVISINVFESDKADVVFTEIDRADEELLIRLEKVTSRETARSLEVYGPWYEIEESKGG